MEAKRPKAIALMSGGLDSTLAAKVVADQGVEVLGLHLVSPLGCRNSVQKNADAVGVKLLFKEKGEAYLDLVKNPRFGYGSQMNPCLDCRIFMFQLADVVRQEEGADFIVTGEVVGQRPMSQQRRSMNLIDNNSPVDGLVLRPLSAHLMPMTIPEKQGWVDRTKLFHISGRGRKAQFELAAALGITDYEAPSGGCLLTEGSFTPRLKDFFAHDEGRGPTRVAQSALLRLGRHFRFSDKLKVIVGRNEGENLEIEALWEPSGGTLFAPQGFSGPALLALGPIDETDREAIGSLIVRYGKGAAPFRIEERRAETRDIFEVSEAMKEERVEEMRIQ
jgi:tRNA-uridine 2-sulfurtransferase